MHPFASPAATIPPSAEMSTHFPAAGSTHRTSGSRMPSPHNSSCLSLPTDTKAVGLVGWQAT
eukprot:2426958-Pleurochrysis_carterae.AAC.1